MPAVLTTIGVLVVLAIALAYAGWIYWAWEAPIALGLIYWGQHAHWSGTGLWTAIGIDALVAAIGGIRPLRQALLSSSLIKVVSNILPKMGDTERIALEAGTVWWDAELFTGDPKWKKLMDFKTSGLSERERAFLEGPVEQLCAMVDDWRVDLERDLPPEVWDFLKKNKFFGIIIPEEFGGLGFSAAAHSAIVLKVASRSGTVGSTVMVPNSLGPAELILHYGTDEQKNHYLPRLAVGEEIPCFALTEPGAGSDAANPSSQGVVCKGDWNGQEVLGMRLTFNKRYITLSPIATLIGLAFKLYDPEHLLGQTEDLGITCALIPRDVDGIAIGQRHDPLMNHFLNGPVRGEDIFVPLDCIIGGPKMAGHGWKMLMQCLAAGRGISLPASACAAAEVAVRGVGAYATVREQFDTPIGKFEGIEEPLARIGGYCYVMNAARTLTTAAIDAGEKPAVLSAILKRYLTESQRTLINDAMDIMGGAAISRGPRNLIARGYTGTPVGITVEGANILTRCLIIFGQGAIRCHPFVQKEMRACAERDVATFDTAFFGHVGFVIKNMVRSLVGGLTDGALMRPAVGDAELARYMGRFTRMAAAFALASDMAMGTLGGSLKRAEKLSGRLADALGWLYLASATMKRFNDEGRPERDRKFLRWGCDHALFEIQTALVGVIDNLPNRPAAGLLKVLVFPLGARYKAPSDRLGAQVAQSLLEDHDERLVLSRDMYSPPHGEVGLGQLEVALDKVVASYAVYRKIREAVKAGRLERKPAETQVARALAAGIITEADSQILDEAARARNDAIQVDSFEVDEFPNRMASPKKQAVASR